MSLGDEGYTHLLGGERVAKDARRLEALGDLDEASSALGVARNAVARAETRPELVRIQRTLYRLMAEVAAAAPRPNLPPLGLEAVRALEAVMRDMAPLLPPLRNFILPGDSSGAAALDLARAIVRRAERHVVALVHDGTLTNPHLVPYLNRLSLLLFQLARLDDRAAGVTELTLAEGE